MPDAKTETKKAIAPLINRLDVKEHENLILGSDYTLVEDGKLTKLDLGLVPLEKLPSDIFHVYPHIEMLNLTGMGLKELDAKIFTKLTKLRVLGLGMNKLTELEPEFFDSNPELDLVSLDGNPLRNRFELEGVKLIFDT